MAETITWDGVAAQMGELRGMAQGLLKLEGSAQTLTPTALVLTALRRQVPAGKAWDEVTWKDRAYFLGAVYQAMRRALIDHARMRNAKKRREIKPVQVDDLRLHDVVGTAREHPEQAEALVIALEWLQAQHPELAEVVQHRYFGDYTIEETARIMGKAERTIRRWWEQARALLHDEVLRLLNEDVEATS